MAERWKALLDRFPEIEPDVERLRSLSLEGPRLPYPPSANPGRRIAIASFALCVAIAALAFVFVALREAPRRLPAEEPDQADTLIESGGTYELSDLRVRYVDPEPSDLTGEDPPPVAVVTFRATWSTPTYPGEADCTVVVRDRRGGEIAVHQTGFSVDGPVLPDGEFTIDLPKGSPRPESAEGTCGPGMIFDGSSQYVFSDLRIEGGKLVGDVAWSAGTPVGYQACGIHAVAPDGSDVFQVLGLGTGPGRDRTLALLGGKFPGDATPEIRCEPYRIPEQFSRAYWMPWGSESGAQEQIEALDASAEPSTYVFTDVIAGPSKAEPQDLAVTFTVSWSGDDYPGVHMCTYRAYAADGSLVGEFRQLAAWQPGRWYRHVPGDPSLAETGEVACDVERLDDPGIADVRPIRRSDGTTIDELTTQRKALLEAWAARYSIESMNESELAGNMWAIWVEMIEGKDEDLTVTWQLADRREYLCQRLPPDHEFRGGEFCD